jgi:hypothetical protein
MTKTKKETKKAIFNLRRKIRLGLKKQELNSKEVSKLYKELEKLQGKKPIKSWYDFN